MMFRRECPTRWLMRISALLFTVGVLVCVNPAAVAGEVSSIFFAIEVDSALGSESWAIASADVDYDPATNTWRWDDTAIQLGDVATLDQANLIIVGDPQIAMGFALTAGTAETTVTITSAVLSFDPLVNPDGAASAGVTLTESGGDPTANLVGLAGNNGSTYAAYYNVAPGTVFAEFVPGLTTNTTISASDNTGGWVPIGATVSNMMAQYSFTLSAEDQASATSNYLIVPEPAGLALLALGAIGALARRRH